MEDKLISAEDENEVAPSPNDDSKLILNDVNICSTFSYPVEIFKIDDKENAVTYKFLHPKKKEEKKTISINAYLDLIRKHNYLTNECSLCYKKQIEFKNSPIFSYCTKCEAVVCSSCIDKHLKINLKNHKDLNAEYIIKNSEKSIKCLLHPKEKNFAFCLKCKTHICKECMKSKKHINHTKNNLIEFLITDKIKNMLNGIIDIYKKRIIQLNKEKKKKIEKFFNEKKDNIEKKQKLKKYKIKEIHKKLEKELKENEKLLNDSLYKLKLKYENEIKICKNNFNISNMNINKKYEKLSIFYSMIFNKEINNIETKYNNNVNSMEYDEKINTSKNLLLINQLLKHLQENYPNNYYNNNNINNIIFKYYESKDKSIKQILSKEVCKELYNKEKEKKVYKKEKKEIENLKIKNVTIDINNKIKIVYKINKEEKNIKILGEKFVKNNKKYFKLLINKKVYDINEYLEYDEYDININDIYLTIILLKIKNEKVTDLSYMFYECESLCSINLKLFNTQYITNMAYMFGGNDYKNGCSSLSTLDLSSFNTEKITNVDHMFAYCSRLKSLNLESFNTENVTNMKSMFEFCSNIKSLNLKSFNTKNVTNMSHMFGGWNGGCSSLKNLDLSSFNTENDNNMQSMFDGCSSFRTINLSSFNTKNVTNMDYMFYNCPSLTKLDLSSFDIKNDIRKKHMFYNCPSIPEKFNTFSLKNEIICFGINLALNNTLKKNLNINVGNIIGKKFDDCNNF